MKTRRPAAGWKQLNLQYTVCIPSSKCAAIAFFILSTICIIFTIVLLAYTSEIVEHSQCFTDTSTISIPSSMSPPVYLYLKFTDYYQNYRLYAKSLSVAQLHGKSDPDLSKNCAPVYRLKDLDYSGTVMNYDDTLTLSSSVVADPCGLIAASFVQHSLSLYKNTTQVEIDSEDIEWETYESNKFKNSGKSQYIDKEDKHFQVWMRTSATKDFLKLYGRVNEKMSGEYKIEIESGEDYLGTDSNPCLVISTANIMGGKNYVLGWVMLVCAVAAGCWVVVFGYLAKSNYLLERRRNLERLI